MFKNADCTYDQGLDARTIYKAILDGNASQEDMLKLSKNFVTTGKVIIKFRQEFKLKIPDENIRYDSTMFSYYAVEPGFIHFEDKELYLLPLFNLNELKTLCRVVVPLKNGTPEIITKENLLILASEFKFASMPNDADVMDIISAYESNTGGAIDFVKGVEPQTGVGTIIDLEYEVQTTKVGTEDKYGNIDYKDKHFTNNVKKGELIGRMTPAVEGVPGRDVFGEVIQPMMDFPDTYKMGQGLQLLEDGRTIVADVEGVLHISPSKTISIGNEEVIAGDLDINIGNLDVHGHVVIKGNVNPGLVIKATGNVYIEGNLEESSVSTKGDLIVNGGIVGSNKSKVEVEGSIFTSFIRNGDIKCKGNVDVSQSVMNSVIESDGFVKVITEKKGKVVGGSITALKGIEVYTAGSNSGVKTHLIAGLDIDREKKLTELNKAIKTNDDNIVKLKQALGARYFQNPGEYLQRLPKEKIPVIKQVIENLKKSINNKNLMTEDLEKLKMSAADQKNAYIAFIANAYDNTSIQIGHYPKLLEKGVFSPTKFVFNNDIKDLIPISIKQKS